LEVRHATNGDEGFRDFLTNALTPGAGESDAAKKHRASIEDCLKANFGRIRFFRAGSFGNGTSISNYSDVDYFASIPTEHLTDNSDVTLTKVRNALAYRFLDTPVRVSCPAVKVPFGQLAKESTEVVPAKYVGDTNGHKVYGIPDCSGGWMRSSPDAHNAYVLAIDQRLNGKVKPLIRFIKAWKYFLNVPIRSFYLELRVAKYAEDESTIIYEHDVRRVLNHLQRLELAKMQDPIGISGYISPCATDAHLDDAKSKLATAITRAERAIAASQKGDIKAAFEAWDLLYGGHFPSYYK